MNPRCFVALELPLPVMTACLSAGRAFLEHAPQWRDQKWVPSHNLHVTVAFLGDVDGHRMRTLEDVLTTTLERLPAPLLGCPHLARVRARSSSLLWIELIDEGASATDLAKAVSEATAPFTGKRSALDHRAWRPHVTLCRTRRPMNAPHAAIEAADRALSAAAAPLHPLYSGAAWSRNVTMWIEPHWRSGGTGRRTRLKIWRTFGFVWVRPPPSPPACPLLPAVWLARRRHAWCRRMRCQRRRPH